jgi:TRAP-type mannitol/chloroaromatic compound transport system permease small subunit
MTSNFASRLLALIDGLTYRSAMVSASMVVVLLLIMGYEVIARSFFDLPTFWAYELAYMVTGLHFIFGIAYVTRQNQHVRIDFIYALLPPRAQAAIDCVVYIGFMMPVTCWISWQLFNVAIEAFIVGETTGESAWNPIIWPLRFFVAIGFSFFALQIVAEAIRSFRATFNLRAEPR